MIAFAAFVLYMGWAMIMPVEPFSGEYWGRIFVIVGLAMVAYRIIEAVEKDK